MKKLGFAILGVLWATMILAQPRPFEIDPSFVPSLKFMQKTWTGEYDGLEPNSKMIISLCRTLVLNEDLTYTNEVRASIKNVAEETLLRYETGTYQYSSDNRMITYSIEADSTLDINILLRGEELSYAVNHYKEEGTEKTSTEEVQFTSAANDNARQWVLFDQQLMSPIDPRQKAVYVMTGKEILPSGVVVALYAGKPCSDASYDLNGRMVANPQKGISVTNKKKGIYIKKGSKYIVR